MAVFAGAASARSSDECLGKPLDAMRWDWGGDAYRQRRGNSWGMRSVSNVFLFYGINISHKMNKKTSKSEKRNPKASTRHINIV